MKVYAVHAGQISYSAKFYKTKELARLALKRQRDDIIKRLVNVIEDTADRFSFYFGWEEHRVTWKVNEIEVLEEVE